MNTAWKWIEGFDDSYVSALYDDSSWAECDLPHMSRPVPYRYVDERSAWGTLTYRRRVSLDTPPGRVPVVRFLGVSVKASVYFDGVLLLVHEGPFTPFDVVLPRPSGLLAVRVDGAEDSRIPPFGGSCDYLVFSGIYRGIETFSRPRDYLSLLQVESRDGRSVTLRGEVEGGDGPVSLTLRDGESVIATAEGRSERGSVLLKIEGLSLSLWDIRSPKLYEADVTFASWTRSVTFGCRSAEFTYGGFFLNGKRVKLIGLDRHQCYPYLGYAMSDNLQREDARILKEGGLNIVRTSHYPQSPAFLDECDRVGLLVFEEIPGWQYVSRDEAWRANCTRNVGDMIRRDINHPSIVLWGVRINESGDDDELYRQTNAIAHATDPTRQTGGVRCFLSSHLLEDVFTYNDFSHSGENPGLLKTKVSAPYLVTEHNGHMFPTKRYDDLDHRASHFLRHMAVLESAFARERISGAIGWCFADYQTHSNFGSGDNICHHGLWDQNREPKFAAYAYISQQDRTPVLVSSSTFDKGDVKEAVDLPIVVATNCQSVNLYRDGIFVKSFYPARARYPHVPHPPVFIDDLFGDYVKETCGFPAGDGEKLAGYLRRLRTRGGKVSLAARASLRGVMKRNKLSERDVALLESRYMEMTQAEKCVWRLEGVIEGKVVRAEEYGPCRPLLAQVLPPEGAIPLPVDGYFVIRVPVRIVREGMTMPLPYAFVPYAVSVTGPLSLLSPSMETTEGGSGAIYLRTRGERGVATLVVKFPSSTVVKEISVV